MRELAMRGDPFTAEERTALLDYCETDVEGLTRLLPKMWPHIDLPRALIRGRYMATVAHIERNGVPVDTKMLARLRENWNIYQGSETLSEPQWPDKSMEDLLNVAFRGHVFSEAEHPVIKRLQGRA